MLRVSVVVVGALLLAGAALWWARVGGAEAPAAADASAPVADSAAVPAAELSRSPGPRPAEPGAALPDPVVVASCGLGPIQEQDVSCQVDGVLQAVLADLGDPVGAGQPLARLDDSLLRPEVESLRIKASSESAKLIAKAQYDDTELKTRIAEKLLAKGVTPSVEYKSYDFQRQRYVEEMRKAREDQEVARKELEKALRALDLHTIRSAIAGQVTKVYKREGESVRQMEPVFRVANCTRLRVEGLCRVEDGDRVRAGMRAVVEPEQASGPVRELRGHTAPVTAVAVSPDGRWVASASEDRTVILRDWPGAGRHAVLTHPAEVYAVALTGAGAGARRLLTGCADGVVRAWEIDANGGLTGPALWTAGHAGAIRALALSPDGRRCASAGEDRRVGVWDVATGALLQWVRGDGDGESAHQGAVTWVQFTSDGHLLSAGLDNVLRVWRLRDGAVDAVAAFPGRTGEVAVLGAGADGRRVLFDSGEELRVLDRDTGAVQGTLRARRQGRFQTFALFSPSGRLVLASASNGRLQLWKAPADPDTVRFFRNGHAHGFRRDSLLALAGLGGDPLMAAAGRAAAPLAQLWGVDGYEVRHLATPAASPATCAAFTPDETFALTGGGDGTVRVWEVPPREEWGQPWEATVTFVASQVERGTEAVRIRAEMDNPAGPPRRLRPGTYVDLRLYPETAPAR